MARRFEVCSTYWGVCKWKEDGSDREKKRFTWKVDSRTIPTRPAWSTIPTSKAHSLPRLRTWRCIHGCLTPKALDLSRDSAFGHWMYVVWIVGDWICSTVWSSSYPRLGELSCSEIFGRCKREPGGGGGGAEYWSCRRWRKESEGSDLSTDVRNKLKGSELVDEKRDIIDGWTDAEKSILQKLDESCRPGSYDNQMFGRHHMQRKFLFEISRVGSTRW